MDAWHILALLKDIEKVAERARASGFPKLQSGLIAVTMATLLDLEDEMLAALTPIVAKAQEQAEMWRRLGFLEPEDE